MEEAELLRAADLIGQLGDPHYLRKANALYSEFEEIGMNRQLGYSSPPTSSTVSDLLLGEGVPVHPGRDRLSEPDLDRPEWINSLYANVFRAEHELRQHGPQP